MENTGSLCFCSAMDLSRFLYKFTIKPVLETTCIRRPPALRDHCSDTTTLLKSIE